MMFIFLSFFFGQIILVCIGVGMSDLEHDVETVLRLCQHTYQHLEILSEMSCVVRKPVFGVSDQVRH